MSVEKEERDSLARENKNNALTDRVVSDILAIWKQKLVDKHNKKQKEN